MKRAEFKILLMVPAISDKTVDAYVPTRKMVMVKGWTCGQWGIHKDKDGAYTVTLLDTGCRMIEFVKYSTAKDFVTICAHTDFPQPWRLAKIVELAGNCAVIVQILRDRIVSGLPAEDVPWQYDFFRDELAKINRERRAEKAARSAS